MSLNVLVIPEDFRKDQYILKPIIQAMLRHLKRPRAKVVVCQDPLLGGLGEALKWERISEIIDRYRAMIDLFIHVVDRDGVGGRRARLDAIEKEAATAWGVSVTLLSENAWQEVEVWVLAGHNDLPTDWSWADIRAEANPKELYFAPYAQFRGAAEGPGEGRKTLAEEAARLYSRIRRLCPEDVGALEARVRASLAAGVS